MPPAAAMPAPTPAQKPLTRIVVVEDHPVTRIGLCHLVELEPDLKVVADVGTGAEALAAIDRLKPDLVLMDLALPDRSGMECVKDIRARHGDRPLILIVSMHDEALYAQRLLRAGAQGYVMKMEATQLLLRAIRALLAGKVSVSDVVTDQIVSSYAGRPGAGHPVDALSDRELEVLRLMGEGLNIRSIAAALGVSSRTVESHRSHIREKLGLADSTELIRFAVRWLETDLIKPRPSTAELPD